MNVEIGTEAALFPEKEYINGIFLTVHMHIKQFAKFNLNDLNRYYSIGSNIQ
jgi:hypothetical protein